MGSVNCGVVIVQAVALLTSPMANTDDEDIELPPSVAADEEAAGGRGAAASSPPPPPSSSSSFHILLLYLLVLLLPPSFPARLRSAASPAWFPCRRTCMAPISARRCRLRAGAKRRESCVSLKVWESP